MSATATRNFDLKEEIRAYWSGRAGGFDASPGHRIPAGRDTAAWQRLLAGALGPLQGKHVLDLACGTGEISRVMLDAGAEVTGVDFAEPMLERAAAKLAGRAWRGRLADVETLAGLSDSTFDGAVTRHLVWTLTDPAAAFAAWFRVLKPGARLLVVDGDWVRVSLRTRLLRRLAALLGTGQTHGGDRDAHDAILTRVPYAGGLTRERLSTDLARAGFVDARPHALTGVYLLGLSDASLAERLRLMAPSRFALSVRKP